jgi:NADH-quinone oxidoreductase subunit G
MLAQIATAVAELKSVAAPVAGIAVGETARRIAAGLASGERVAVLLGNAALQSPQAAQIEAWAQWIAQATGAVFGVIGEAANSVGAQLVDAQPRNGGLDARAMLEQPRRAYLLWNLEPEYDTANPSLTLSALASAETVISFSAYRNGAMEYADAILPIAPFLETSGTFVNAEGRAQSFNGAVRPLGDARPGWKVLRVIGAQLGLPGFDLDSPEAVRAALPSVAADRLDGRSTVAPQVPQAPQSTGGGLQRLTDVPVNFSDALVRRAQSLQKTADARAPRASANVRTLAAAGLAAGDKARVRQTVLGNEVAALLEVALDDRLPDGVVRVPAGHAATSTLGPMFGAVRLERA